MKRSLNKVLLFLYLIFLLMPSSLYALEIGKTNWTGYIESYYQVFTSDADSLRLPENTYRIQLNSQFEGYNFTLPFRLIIDQNQSNLRQSINKFLFNPKWSHVELLVGDFYPVLSDLSVSGINLRGAGLKLNSKAVRFQITGGQINKPIEPIDSIGGTYSRYLVATQLGFGNENSFFLDINGFKAWDDTASIGLGTNLPQENLLLSLKSGLKAGFFKLSGEYAISGFTRNMFASELENFESIPIIQPLFKTRISSRKSEAVLLSTTLEWSQFSFKGDLKRISPGFMSLGRTYSDEDIQDIFGEIRYRTSNNKFSFTLNTGMSNDNLTDEKLFTSSTKRYGVQGNYIISPKISLAMQYSGLLLQNDADTNALDQFNHTFSLSPTIRFGEAAKSQLVNIILMKQWLDDRSKLTTGFDNMTLTANWTATRGSNLTFVAGTSFNSTSYDTSSTDIFSLNGNVIYKPWKTFSINLGFINTLGSYSDYSNSRLSYKGQIIYEPTKSDKFSLEASNSAVSTDKLATNGFIESTAQVSYRRRL